MKRKPIAKECDCLSHYPNPMRKERCRWYECVQETSGHTWKTKCRLIEGDEPLEAVTDIIKVVEK